MSTNADINIFRDPQIAHKSYTKTGFLVAPFTSLNSTIQDMLQVYAKDILKTEHFSMILSKIPRQSHKAQGYCLLNIFSSKKYKEFLQMISKEFTPTAKTTKTSILYSNISEESYQKFHTFINNEQEKYDNIESTEYASFSRTQPQLLCVETYRTVNGTKMILTEYNLFVP